MDRDQDYGARDIYFDPGVRLLIMMRRTLRRWAYDEFRSPFWRLYWNSASGAVVRHGAQRVPLTPDRLLLVPPYTPISMRLERAPVTHFYAHFILESPIRPVPPQLFVIPAVSWMLDGIASLPPDDRDHLTQRVPTIMAVRGLIYRLLGAVASDYLYPQRLSDRLREGMAHVDAHLDRLPSNAELARRAGVSIPTLLRQFHRELGMTPRAYGRHARIKKACALLRDPRMSIKQVAEQAGFCDRYHFTKAFAAAMGLGPARFRAQQRELAGG